MPLERLPAVGGADVVDEQQVAGLPRHAGGVRLVDLVDQLDDVRADRVAVAEAGVERQPVSAVLVHQELVHLGRHRPLVEEGDLVEPAAVTRERVLHDGWATLPGAQPAVGLPLELDGVGLAVPLDLAAVVAAEGLGDRRPDLVVVAAGEQPPLALEAGHQCGRQGAEHCRSVGHTDRTTDGGLGDAGEHHQARELERVAQLVVHAHRLVRRPRCGCVDAGGARLPWRERLDLGDQRCGELVGDGSEPGRVVQPEASDQHRTVLGGERADPAVLARPARGVAGDVGHDRRRRAGLGVHVEGGGEG